MELVINLVVRLMKNKLNVKLIGSYLLLSFIVVFTLVLIINFAFENQFKKYVMNIQQEKNQKVVNVIIDEYEKSNQKVDSTILETIGMNALEDGLIVRVTDNRDNIVWDAMIHNSGMCVEMLSKMANNMKRFYPNFKGNHTENEYLLENKGILYGKVTIGYYGPYYFNDNDIAFLNTFYNMIIFVIVLSILLSLIFGVIIARKITSNITKVVDVTRNIAHGHYDLQITDNTNIIEISDLIKSINFLADNLNSQTILRKKLTIDISHELRTPVAVLKSHLEALKDGVWVSDQKRIESLYDEVTRLSRIINSIDKLNDYDSKEAPLNKTNFDLCKLVNSVVVNFDKQLIDKNINIKILGDNVMLQADKDQMTSVLVNLLSNAVKYTNELGAINIKIKEKSEKVVIEISDNGIGIDKKHVPYIFERFYRIDDSRSRTTGGMGIGLSIVKSIIELHDGTIEVKSKINQGTTFIITLPKLDNID